MSEPVHPSQSRVERSLLAVLAAAILVLLAPAALRSPDGMEIIGRIGEGHLDLDQWPPLWPGLVWLGGLVMQPVHAAWLIGLCAAAATAVPIHRLAGAIGGRVAARAAVLTWAILPAVQSHASVLDARPLSWLLLTWTAALVAEAARGWRSWGIVFLPAALAPLCRPEAVAAIFVALVAGLLLGAPRRRLVSAAALACGPLALVKLLSPGGRSQWEGLWLPWSQTWPGLDFVALNGAANAGTHYRAFALSMLDAGLESVPFAPQRLLPMVGPDIPLLVKGMVGSTGLVVLALAAVGTAGLIKRQPRGLLLFAAVMAPLLGLLLLPMAWMQATLEANVLWTAPLSLAMAGTALASGLRRLPLRQRPRLAGWIYPLLLVALVSLETRLSPWRSEPPLFLEGTECADRMVALLAANPPATGQVACTITGRAIVRRAGLVPIALPSRWEEWHPVDDIGVLISSTDLGGNDGGRGLDLLMDGAWKVRAVSQDMGGGPPEERDPEQPPQPGPQAGLFWYLYLGR
ncbi:MAG: glycosyltransferase family 39 protein [Oligoflexia bacterium]|nr:glycosyltransferase family 39 protein [Oligoflexia bacterium]